MEDKLVHLSVSDEKSSNFKKPKCFCGNTPERELRIKQYIKDYNLNTKNVSNNKSIPSSSILIKELPNNPYCSSITGQYAFDLSQISNFNVYFWTSTDDPTKNPTKNDAIEREFYYYSTYADNWTSDQKIQVKKALDTYTTFTTSTVVNNYNDCDIVCVLINNTDYYGSSNGPFSIKYFPVFFNNKIVYFINNHFLNGLNIEDGGFMYSVMIHAFGHGFGLGHPFDDSFDSTIMPGVLTEEAYNYQGIGGYIQNNIFNTVMSNVDTNFFLPETHELLFNLYGYPETIMPLDALALRWLYNIQQVPVPYVNTYGVQLINEGPNDTYHSRMIVGKNQNITFGSNCTDIAFYLSNQYFTFNNLNYLRFEYIRNLENDYSFYTKDIDATVSGLNLDNAGKAYIFIENRSLVTSLTINLISSSATQALYLYVMDASEKYESSSSAGVLIFRNRATGKKIIINNPNYRELYFYFNETIITRNINNKMLKNVETKKEVNQTKPKELKCGCGNIHDLELEIEKYSKGRNLNTQQSSNNKSIPESSIIYKIAPYNPYCSSITGTYAFDLTKISNFNVYFWTETDNPNLNQAIYARLNFPDTISAVDWSNIQKTQCKKALDIYTTFTGTTSTIVDNYFDCDIVCVLAPFNFFLGLCYGPNALFREPTSSFVDNKICYFISNNRLNDLNIQEGGFMYNTMIHEWGHGFGLEHPQDTGANSTIMPAVVSAFDYPAIGGYIQNNIFNTVMTYNAESFFLPKSDDYNTNLIGYPQTILPLDALGLRWLYDIQEIPARYIDTYGVQTINPDPLQNQSAMIVGKNQIITFGSNNYGVNFYLTNQHFTYYNLQPIKIEYNRPILKEWAFYPRDLDSTISTVNLENTGQAFIFLENRALSTNLTVNILNNYDQTLDFYCMDCYKNYTITGNVYRNKITGKTFTINNYVDGTVNVYFEK